MGIGKVAKKLDAYFGRLEGGRAAEIKPSHVKKAIAKLQSKRELLQVELRDAEKQSKKRRIENKLVTVGEQIERAEWLLNKLET